MPYSPCIMVETVIVVSIPLKMHLADVTYRNRNGVEGGALPGDNPAARLSYILLDFLADSSSGLVIPGVWISFWQSLIGTLEMLATDQGMKRRVAVLAENIGVHIGLVNIVIFGKSGSQPCGVQNRTRTDDVVVGKSGHLVECVGQNVHRVADDDINGNRAHIW